MIALIMAGGIGSRFWPLSRRSKPKQYLSITSEKTMIQLTVERLKKEIKIDDIYVVTSEDQKELVQKDLPRLPEDNIIIEPFGRNTAPCIGLSAKYLAERYSKDETVFVLPADHIIGEHEEFWKKTKEGETAALENYLVTFGIKPTYPATGYGYIESGENYKDNLFHVKQFKEKPNEEKAQNFLASGNFYWNSGMFLWKIETILKKFDEYLPKISKLLDEIASKWKNEGKTADISNLYDKMPKIPVDIGIMEQAEKRIVVPVKYNWSDVGSWEALYDISEKDENMNVVNCENICLDSQKNYIYSKKFVAAVGVENLVLVETDDAILISSKDKTQAVKEIVNNLKKEKPLLT